MSLNKEKVSREISETKIAVCEKTQGLRSGNFSDLNSACSTVLVPVKIFQFQDMHYENRFLGTFQGHGKRPISLENVFAELCTVTHFNTSKSSCLISRPGKVGSYKQPLIQQIAHGAIFWG